MGYSTGPGRPLGPSRGITHLAVGGGAQLGGARFDVDRVTPQELAAAGAADLGGGQLPAVAVAQEDGRTGVAGGVPVAPGRHGHEDAAELTALLGQVVLIALGSLLVGPALQ